MKALVLDRPGSPATMHLAQLPQPQPLAGEIRVAVHTVGLNPVDYKFALSGLRSWTYPFILGLDVAGIVDAVGPDAGAWEVGDRVYYHGDVSRPGGFAEWAIAAAHAVAPLPSNLSWAEAAALPCAGFTAYQALYRKLHIQPGQTVLIQGGSGGVGGFAVQLAAHSGTTVISTCSPRNFEWVRQLGAGEVLDYGSDLVTAVRQVTGGRGVDAILDTVGAESATSGLEMLAFGGGIACVAGLPDFRHMRSFGKALSVHDVALGGAYLSGDRIAQEDLGRIGREVGALASAGKIRPMLERTITLEEVPQVLARWTELRTRGKIVAQVRPSDCQ